MNRRDLIKAAILIPIVGVLGNDKPKFEFKYVGVDSASGPDQSVVYNYENFDSDTVKPMHGQIVTGKTYEHSSEGYISRMWTYDKDGKQKIFFDDFKPLSELT